MFAAIPLGLKIATPLVFLALISGLVYSCEQNLINRGEAKEQLAQEVRAREHAEKEAKRLKEKEQARLDFVEKAARETEEANSRFLKTKQRASQLERKIKDLESRDPEVRYETVQVEVEKVVERIVGKELPCLVADHQRERLNDDVRVFNDLVASYRDEGAGEAATEPTLHTPSTITCDQIPDLASELIGRLTNTSIKYRTLSDYVVDGYDKDLAAKEQDE